MITMGPEGITKGKNNFSYRDILNAIKHEEIISVIPTSVRNGKLHFNINDNLVGTVSEEDLVDTRYNKHENIEYKVGYTINVVPVDIITKNDRQIVVCSRALAQHKCHVNYIDSLEKGDIIDAKVVNMTKCGVFCDIGCGNIALMTMNDIAMSYVNNAKDVFKNQQFIKVMIKNKEHGRIMISMKELLGTWDDVIKEFSKGDVVVGKVILINEYGAFIRVRYNLVGLIDRFPDDIKVNDFISVKIDNIQNNNNRIKLSMIGRSEPVAETIKYFYNGGHIENWSYIQGKNSNELEYSLK